MPSNALHEKLVQARSRIKDALVQAQSPVVWWSGGGKDSLLLLHLAREVNPRVDVLWFRPDVGIEQKAFALEVIREWDLTVTSYAPASRHILPSGDGLLLADEYSVGSVPIPFLTDISEGERCAAGISGERTPFFGYPFDVTLVGWKTTDEQFVSQGLEVPGDGFQLGPTRLYSPLRGWTDGEVLQAIADFKIPYRRFDDSLPLCTRCLQSTEPVFCPEAKAMIPPSPGSRRNA
jgi:hypothetical protein